ncbi:hypothetical protein [Stappia sp. MMSF_3263]|uniref:hypothetical protein n=1 Tax=Stappia sp. MMSF_3263 TaxID=3046693 RepID=UPI00273DAF18|nr:hypothetical protein [Stappia sp. MMSF_3263]
MGNHKTIAISRLTGTALRPLAAGALMLGTLAAIPAPAAAESCWMHNGSVMRLQATGDRRWFSYDNPRPQLRRAGVTPGTVLFEGVKRGNWYEGTARVFSRHCPGQPQVYSVAGPVRPDQLQVTVSGTRNINRQCHPTDAVTTDTLIFTYSHQC